MLLIGWVDLAVVCEYVIAPSGLPLGRGSGWSLPVSDETIGW